MSAARSQFLGRISSLVRSLGIEAVTPKALTERAHNEVARLLRNGLAVVGFAALEDFIKSRTSEILSDVGSTGVPFRDLPERLRFATTFEAVSALSYQLNIRPKQDRIAYMQDQAQKIASTASAAYELMPHALAFDQANVQDETIKLILKSFHIDDPWGEMSRLSSRLGLTALPLDETYRMAAQRRHRAAHVANADTPQADLHQFTIDATGIAIGFDALLTRALERMRARDSRYLQGIQKVSSNSLTVRAVRPHGARWRETVEGRTTAVKIGTSLDSLLPAARSRCARGKNLLVVFESGSQVREWDCY
ncbi:hypothetical protein [Trinickia soli]|nr:hypothetical protein [Trinickia soli]CAB3699886.1 hypothetical protein LMG24076_03371 [Trinickia soli]